MAQKTDFTPDEWKALLQSPLGKPRLLSVRGIADDAALQRDVDWAVLREPIEAAKADIDHFAQLYPMNARPAQERNRRFILSESD